MFFTTRVDREHPGIGCPDEARETWCFRNGLSGRCSACIDYERKKREEKEKLRKQKGVEKVADDFLIKSVYRRRKRTGKKS